MISAQMLEMVKPGEVDVAYDSLDVAGRCSEGAEPLNLFCTQSEFLSLLMATMANDEIKQDDAGLFAYNPIR